MFKNKNIFISIFFIVILSLLLGSWKNYNKYVLQYAEIPYPPASLDAYYPPKSEQPVFVLAMLGMDNSFSGIIVDLMEQDIVNAGINYENFKEQYFKVSKMVPEWESNYPADPVDELGKAMQTGDMGKIMASVEEVGKVCGNCHFKNMVPVQQKYHWRDFESITVTDQASKESTSFSSLMLNLSMNFSGISVNLQEGQVDNAKKQFEQFKSRFLSLKATCTHCHTTPRKYYVDESVSSMVDELGKALEGPKIDSKLVGELSMKIGHENCFKCHMVHMPAAVTKYTWKMQGKK